MVDLLNGSLPPDIRVLGIQRTMNRFDPRWGAGSRIYHYLIPSYLFDAEFRAQNVDHLEWKHAAHFLRAQRLRKGLKGDDAKCDDDTDHKMEAIWKAKDVRFGYRIKEELLDRLQSVLQCFVG